MMKKTILSAALLTIGVAAFAQKSNIRAAETHLEDGNLDKARTAIDAAVNDESTKDNTRAWYVRGVVYLQLQAKNEDKDYYKEAGKSLQKAVALKPDYETTDVNNKLFAVGIYSFNAGLGAYEKRNYDEAYNDFSDVVNIYNMDGGKRFGSMKKFDTIAHQSILYQGYSAYYNNKYDEALAPLLKSKSDPIVKNANVYLMLADIYDVKKDDANLLATINEGKKEYPSEKALTNRELNYYIKSGKTDELVKKLEDAVKADPGNADLIFTVGQTYDGMANPKDKSGNELAKPANFEDLFNKAEAAYQEAIKINAGNAGFNYNLGALYFNRSVMINDKMNAIEGNSAADIKKYDGLKAQRDAWFDKALPFLEKSITIWEPNAKSLKGEDASSYQGAIIAATKIYAVQNKADKVKELKSKLEAFQK